MRNVFAEKLYQIGKKNKKICCVVADISPAGSMLKFSKKFPKRFINVGVAEQAMIGICAGLATQGMRPFAYTIASFSLYRPFEMIKTDLCYQNLPVTIVGMGSGLAYSTLGGTHHTAEDIAICNSLPNMQIIAPCEPFEVSKAIEYCSKQNVGPVYLKLGKAGEPNISTKKSEKWKFGKLRFIVKSKKKEICILSYGRIMIKALEIYNKFNKNNIDLISVHTLKPIDKSGLEKVLRTYNKVIIIEEHTIIGGLTSIVKNIQADLKVKTKIFHFTLKDKFIHCYGTNEDLLDTHNLSSKYLIKKFSKLISKKK
jgi:transketolase